MNMQRMMALLMVLVLMVSGVHAVAEDTNPVLATAYDGAIELRLEDVQANYDALLQNYIAYYAQNGYTVDEYNQELQTGVAQESVQVDMSQRIVEYYVAQNGYVLTAEQEEEMKAQAQAEMDSMVEYYESYLAYYGLTGEELTTAVEQEIAASGYSAELILESMKLQAVLDYLYGMATADVTITDEEVKTAFDAKIETATTTYADVDAFISAYLGEEEILYTPEGVRLIHCIYFQPAAQEEPAAAETADAETADAETADAEAAEAAPARKNEKAETVLAEIRAGKDFDEAMHEYNEDSSTAEQLDLGYPVAEGSQMYDETFYNAAMALQNPGDVSDVLVTDYGCFILRYSSDLTAGTVEFEPRKEQETQSALTDKKNAAYSEYVNNMINEAGIVMNDLSPLYHVYVSNVVEAKVAYAVLTAQTALTDMPAGDAVATLGAGASVDVLGYIGVDGEDYAFVAVPGTAYKGYIDVTAMADMDAETALAVDNTALVTAAAAIEKDPTFTIVMNDGSVIYGELYPQTAPQSVGNFAALAGEGFYDGLIFHRVIADFMIQGGDATGTGSGSLGYSIRGEFSANGIENPVSHERGVLSMARTNVMDSAGSQFFIVHADSTFLDGQYAAFGRVLGGIETVDAIAAVKTNSSDKPMDDQVMRTVFVETYGKTYEFEKLAD